MMFALYAIWWLLKCELLTQYALCTEPQPNFIGADDFYSTRHVTHTQPLR